MIRGHDLLVNPRTRDIFKALRPTKRILDVGACVRPCPVFECEEHICVEPHDEYCDVLRTWKPAHASKVRVVHATAEVIESVPRRDTTVLLLDVIEHMSKPDGAHIRDVIEEFDQAVIFTPLGFIPQNEDRLGYNGAYWQTHRSGWFPHDFANWRVMQFPVFFNKPMPHGAILAVRQA